MIARVCGGFIDEIDRLATEVHPLAFEAQVRDAGLILVASAPVVLEEQVERADGVEQSALDGNLLDVV